MGLSEKKKKMRRGGTPLVQLKNLPPYSITMKIYDVEATEESGVNQSTQKT